MKRILLPLLVWLAATPAWATPYFWDEYKNAQFCTAYYATGSGNWSSDVVWSTAVAGVATKSGSQLSPSVDTAEMNGFQITLDSASLSCSRISTISGGTLAVSTSAQAKSIIANIQAGTKSCVVLNGNSFRLSVTGNVNGGGSSSAYGINAVTAPVVDIVGNVTGGSATSAHGLYSGGSTGNPTVVGNVTGGSGAISNITSGININTSAADTVTVTGNITGGAGGAGINLPSRSFIILNGSLNWSSGWGEPVAQGRLKWASSDGTTISLTDASSATHTLLVPLAVAASNIYTGIVVSNSSGTTTGTLTLATSSYLTTATFHNIAGTWNATNLTPATVAGGVTYGPSLSLSGTYTGAGSSSDPGVNNVLNGVTYIMSGTTLAGNYYPPADNRVQAGLKFGISNTGSTGSFYGGRR